MKGVGKAACILPHGVLFRGNAEATIREQLVRSGYLKGIIGLPANLFYGTGIPACIVVIDKENAAARKGVFMIDASRGFIKDGNKNRLRERDIHRIVDTFTRQANVPRFARLVPFDEIADTKNDFNLNLPRYIDSTDPEDLQDIGGHLRGGIPERDLDALSEYWQVLPSVRAALFESAGRPGYARMTLSLPEVKPAILGHAEFVAFQKTATKRFADWRKTTTPRLMGFGKDGHPKKLIETIAEDLLARFRKAPLIDAYDVYQHLMDFWAETMQDDTYLIAADGWVKGAQPREIVRVKNKNNKLVWPEPHDYLKGKRRFKSDLVPASIFVARYFVADVSRAVLMLVHTANPQTPVNLHHNCGRTKPARDGRFKTGQWVDVAYTSFRWFFASVGLVAWVLLPCGLGRRVPAGAVAQTVALAGDGDDLGVMEEAIEDGGGAGDVADEFAPIL